MRVAREKEVIGEWPVAEVARRIESGSLLPTDFYYDEDALDWMPLSEFLVKRASVKVDKGIVRPCYCGSTVPFKDCCGDGSQY